MRVLTTKAYIRWGILAFSASSLLAGFISYDGRHAGIRVAVLGVGSLGLILIGSLSSGRLWRLAGWLSAFSMLIALPALLFFIGILPSYESNLDQGMGVTSALSRYLEASGLSKPNQVAGAMLLLIPFSLSRLVVGWKKGNVHEAAVYGSITFINLITVLWTGSRTALGCILFITTIWALSRGRDEIRARIRSRRLWPAGAFLIAAVLIAAAVMRPLIDKPVLQAIERVESVSSRAEVYQNSLFLIRDFPLTGIGLDAFPGMYSRYVLDIPHRFLDYSHNLYLDLHLNVSWIGLFGFLAIYLGSWLDLLKAKGGMLSGLRSDVLRQIGLAGIPGILLFGILDNPFHAMLNSALIFLLPAFAVGISMVRGSYPAANSIASSLGISGHVSFNPLRMGLILVGIGFMGMIFGGKLLVSRAYSNIGALLMAKVELQGWPTGEWVVPDAKGKVHQARGMFQKALNNDPNNHTALHRLGLLDVQQGRFSPAMASLQRAHELAPDHPGILKALAYSTTWSGNERQGYELLLQIPEVVGELEAYIWWWKQQGRLDLSNVARDMLIRIREVRGHSSSGIFTIS